MPSMMPQISVVHTPALCAVTNGHRRDAAAEAAPLEEDDDECIVGSISDNASPGVAQGRLISDLFILCVCMINDARPITGV